MSRAKIQTSTVVKLQIAGGKATAAHPVGPALGPHGINIGLFIKSFNEKTANMDGIPVPVVITINKKDRSFTFILKTPPASALLKKACGLQSASAAPNKTKVAKITQEQLRAIAQQKMPDLTAANEKAAISVIAGTARSMGIEVED